MSDAIVPKGQPIAGDPEKKGWLFKWTNYLKGYQRRWFVLSNGLLSYYRNQAEMAHTCRGTISLLGALIHTADSCTFVISNGGTQTFHIRAHDEVERQSWVTVLELAKAKAIRAQESDDDDEQMGGGAASMPGEDGEDAGGIARELAARFHDLRTCSELVARHGAALQRSLVDLEIPPTDNTKQVSERATLFRISCNAMMNACSEFMSAAALSSARMSRALQHEREQKTRLQEVVEQLARQHDNLEKTVTGRAAPSAGPYTIHRMSRALQHEREQKTRLQEVVEQLARQHDNLEKTVTGRAAPSAGPYTIHRMSRALQHEREQKTRLQEVVEQLARQHDNLEKTVTGRAAPSAGPYTIHRMSRALQHEREQKTRLQEVVEQLARQHDNLEKTVTGRAAPSAGPYTIHRMSRALQHEREQKTRLQEVVEQLARQHDNLEKTVTGRAAPSAGGNGTTQGNETEDEDHEFFDAMEDGAVSTIVDDKNSFVIKVPVNRKNKAKSTDSDESEGEVVTETQQVVFVEDKERPESSMGGVTPPAGTGAGAAPPLPSKAKEDEMKIFPHVSQVRSSVDDHPRRTRVPDRPNYPLSLWSIMKNCIGKELSKIPIPVNFSEPLSMLQRLTEEYEYSSVLDQAAQFSDPAQQLAYVAAFTVSSYATTSCRTNKPFNPLLGETFECDRMTDLGWRSISEQVSHHPPMVAQWCEGAAGWLCWQEFTMTTKFRGKYLQVIPLGGASCEFPASGNKYSWRKVEHHPPTTVIHCEGSQGWISDQMLMVSSRFRGQYISVEPKGASYISFLRSGNIYCYKKVTTTVHNIIVGKLWVDNHGDMDIIGEAGPATGYVAHLKYLPYGYFSKDTQRKVTGVIKDPQGVPRYVLQGHWNSRVEVAPVTSASQDNTQCKTGKFTVAWERVPEPADADKWYNFTLLAAQLNEMEKGVAPTDSRRRPDQRLMEEGLWDDANQEKLRLEEKQRAKRRQLEAAAEEAASVGGAAPVAPAPLWFTRQSVAAPGDPLRHLYNHRYWETKRAQDWANCPDIF